MGCVHFQFAAHMLSAAVHIWPKQISAYLDSLKLLLMEEVVVLSANTNVLLTGV